MQSLLSEVCFLNLKKKKKQPVSEINRGTLANGIKYHVEDSHCYPLVSSQELNKE